MSVQLYLSLLGIVVAAALATALLEIHKESRRINKMDIEIEKMRQMESKLAAFYEKNGISPGTDLEAIAQILKVTWGKGSDNIKSQAVLSNPDKRGIREVTFKEGLSQKTKRFVFAHECAHLINGDSAPLTRPLGRNKPMIEQLADYTAAALLMPLDEVYDYLEKNGYQKATKRRKIELVCKLCKTYEVTEMIAVRRIKEVYAIKQETL